MVDNLKRILKIFYYFFGYIIIFVLNCFFADAKLGKNDNLDLNSEQLSRARALEKLLSTFEFELLTTIWYKTLIAVNDASRLLQSEAITIDNKLLLIGPLLEDVERIRGSWLQIF